jgi:hypothetical protein
MQCGASFLRITDNEGFITWVNQSTEGNDYNVQELEVLHYAAINER